MRVVTFALVALLVSVVLAADQPADNAPKSPQAIAAETKYQQATKKATEAYWQAVLAADKGRVADLDAALKAAMAAGSADEVMRVAAAKKAAEAQLKSHVAKANDQNVTVYDFSDQVALSHFNCTGLSHFTAGKGLEFPGRQWSYAISKERFTYPIVAVFEAYCEADGVLDIEPRVFVQTQSPNMPDLGIFLGTDWNRATVANVFGQGHDLTHMPLQAMHTYIVQITVDSSKKVTMWVDSRLVYTTTIDDANLLAGPIKLTGGGGHVIYKRVTITGRQID